MAGLTTNDVGDCCCEGGCLPCSPCSIPRKDLRIRVAKPDETPPSYTATLVYNPTGPIWVTSPVAPWGLNPSLSCSADTIALSGIYPNVGLADFTCNPFHFHYRGPIQPVDYFIDDPGPTTPCPCVCTVHVVGCGGLPLAVAFVSLSGVAGTSTTDTSGNATFTVLPGTYDVTVNRPRFTTTTFAAKTLACATPATVDMSGAVAAGYACSLCCAVPFATTVLASSFCVGNAHLVWDGTNWTDGSSTFYANCQLDSGASMGALCANAGLAPVTVNCPPAAALTYTSGGQDYTVTE